MEKILNKLGITKETSNFDVVVYEECKNICDFNYPLSFSKTEIFEIYDMLFSYGHNINNVLKYVILHDYISLIDNISYKHDLLYNHTLYDFAIRHKKMLYIRYLLEKYDKLEYFKIQHFFLLAKSEILFLEELVKREMICIDANLFYYALCFDDTKIIDYLISHKCPINIQPIAFPYTVSYDNLEKVIKYGLPKYASIFYAILKSGDIDKVNLLLKYEFKYDVSKMFDAVCYSENLDYIRFMLTKFSLSMPKDVELASINNILQNNRIEILKFLYSEFPKTLTYGFNKFRAYFVNVTAQSELEIWKYIIEYMKITPQKIDFSTLIHRGKKGFEIIKYLYTVGLSIELTSHHIMTALYKNVSDDEEFDKEFHMRFIEPHVNFKKLFSETGIMISRKHIEDMLKTEDEYIKLPLAITPEFITCTLSSNTK